MPLPLCLAPAYQPAALQPPPTPHPQTRLAHIAAAAPAAVWLDDAGRSPNPLTGWAAPCLALGSRSIARTRNAWALIDHLDPAAAPAVLSLSDADHRVRELLARGRLLAGFQSYGLHPFQHRLPPPPDDQLLAWWLIVDQIVDPASNTLLQWTDQPRQPHRPLPVPPETTFAPPPASAPPSSPRPAPQPLQSDQQFLHAIRRALDYIAAGDIYQVNIARAWQVCLDPPPDPALLALKLLDANGGGFGAFLRLPQSASVPGLNQPPCILCTSPELFLRVRDRQVCTCPIKGTRPLPAAYHASSPNGPSSPNNAAAPRRQARRAALRNLLGSPKERAELAMITDLLRNDLSPLAAIGSVRVRRQRAVRQLPGLLHTYSHITACLQPQHTAWDLLAHATPGGSITGCPKLRAMQVIAELEPFHRGIYCGTIGWIHQHAAELNIAIRTATLHGTSLWLAAGSGIVAESDPEAELAETHAKLARLLTALTA